MDTINITLDIIMLGIPVISIENKTAKNCQNLKISNFGHQHKMGYFQLICDISKAFEIRIVMLSPLFIFQVVTHFL